MLYLRSIDACNVISRECSFLQLCCTYDLLMHVMLFLGNVVLQLCCTYDLLMHVMLFLGNVVLQLCCTYGLLTHVMLFPILNVLYFYFLLSKTCAQCSVLLFSEVPRFSALPLCFSCVFSMILRFFRLPPL